MAALHLSRNFGHQAAVSAGIDHARGQAVVVMDGDLKTLPRCFPSSSRNGAKVTRWSTRCGNDARRASSSAWAISASTGS